MGKYNLGVGIIHRGPTNDKPGDPISVIYHDFTPEGPPTRHPHAAEIARRQSRTRVAARHAGDNADHHDRRALSQYAHQRISPDRQSGAVAVRHGPTRFCEGKWHTYRHSARRSVDGLGLRILERFRLASGGKP
jgi:hypothetical protein